MEIPPVSAGIGEARRFTKELLRTWGLGGMADTATLLISELVTNAILHGGDKGAVLTLAVADRALRVEVRDGNGKLPVVRAYSDTATTGRGMVIVDALAANWGSFPVEDGKVVWFELPTGERQAHPASGDQKPAKISEVRGMVTGARGSPLLGSKDGLSIRPIDVGRVTPAISRPSGSIPTWVPTG